MTANDNSIALVPDRFARYRYPVFRLISDEEQGGAHVVIYADPLKDSSGVRLVPSEFCNMDYDSGGIRWKSIRSFYFGSVCFWQTGLQRLALKGKFKVIVYWGEAHRISTWLSAALARLSGKKVVFWTHGIYGNEGFLKKKIRTYFYRLADSILLYGEHGKRQLESVGISSERLHVINNSLDVQAQLKKIESMDSTVFCNIKSQFCRENEHLLVFVGRLEPQKQLGLLIQAVAMLKQDGKSVKALLIGDGSQRNALTQQAIDLGVGENVIFFGESYEEDLVLPLLAASDICVSPGEVGLTAMHALVCGTPVISHNDFPNQMPEFEAIREGRSGAFFRRGDVRDLVEKIVACLSAIDLGQITIESCREQIVHNYTPEFQRRVFYRAVEPLLL